MQPRDIVQAPEQIELEFAPQFGKRRNDNIFTDRQTGEQLIDLVALGQAELTNVDNAHAGDIAPVEHDLAGARRDFAGQHLEERRLAGAVGADDAAQFAAMDRKIDIAVGEQTAVALGQTARLEDRTGMAVAARRRAGIAGSPMTGRCGFLFAVGVTPGSTCGSTGSGYLVRLPEIQP